jgi:hypothetical protein
MEQIGTRCNSRCSKKGASHAPHLIRESHELGHGVGPSREDEDQRHCLGQVLEHRLEVHGGRLDKRLAKLSGHKLQGCLFDCLQACLLVSGCDCLCVDLRLT